MKTQKYNESAAMFMSNQQVAIRGGNLKAPNDLIWIWFRGVRLGYKKITDASRCILIFSQCDTAYMRRGSFPVHFTSTV